MHFKFESNKFLNHDTSVGKTRYKKERSKSDKNNLVIWESRITKNWVEIHQGWNCSVTLFELKALLKKKHWESITWRISALGEICQSRISSETQKR